ncbi:outer membrane protein [Methylotenera sp. N17]|uniref:outer membrane protein n=1 Tax=Methylotenera sp. N17 TaxID=1502761 RepID=UPI000648A81B|nr:outer membrane beta-barrel protein [Methylotenera sp. N17]
MKKMLVILGFISISHSVFAEDYGFYAGLNIGIGKADFNTPNGLDKSRSLVSGLVLGYKLNQYFGVEGQYTGIGKVTDNVSGSAKADALSLSAIGYLPVNEEFNLYGKLGVAATKSTVSSSLSPMNDASRTSVTYGFGGQYNLNKDIGMRLGWDHYNAAVDMSSGNKHNINANVVSVGVVYNF